jgi:acetolactate synthase-1/2/3 large subunit
MCYGLPVKIIILNNGYLGMVRQWQELFYHRNYCATGLEAQPDFVKLAEAYGSEGYLVTKKNEVVPTLNKAFASKKLVIVNVVVEQEENVYPMVPAGASLAEMLLV